MFQTFQPLKHANLECSRKKELPKTGGDWDLKPVDFQNMCEIKLINLIRQTTQMDYFCHGIPYPIGGLCCIVLFISWQ